MFSMPILTFTKIYIQLNEWISLYRVIPKLHHHYHHHQLPSQVPSASNLQLVIK